MPLAGAPDVAESAVRLVRSDADGIVVAFDLPPYDLESRTLGGQAYQVVDAPGLTSSGPPGYPDLPVAAVLLGIPPRGEPRLRSSVLGTQTLDQPVRIAPVASPVEGAADGALAPAEGSAPARALAPRMVAQANAAAYASAEVYPAEPAAITEVGWIRNQRYARLELRPFQYTAARGRLRAHVSIRVELTMAPSSDPVLSAGLDSPGEVGGDSDRAFDVVFDRVLLNAEAARAWQVKRPAAYQSAVESLPPGPSEVQQTWNIAVGAAGMVRVTGTELALAGLPIDAIDPRRLQLYAGGAPAAMWVQGEEDGLFGAADALVFYAEPSPSRYAAFNVYQLAYGEAPGLRIAEADGSPARTAAPEAFTDTLRVEEDLLYRSDYPRRTGLPSSEGGSDHWFWQQLSAPLAFDRLVTLPAIAPGAWTGRLRVALVGKSSFPSVDPDHRLQVSVAGGSIGEASFDGNDAIELRELPVGSDRLSGGNVAFRFEAPQPELPLADFYDQYYVDWFEVEYRRSFTAGADGLRFTYDVAAPTDFSVTGLASDDVAVFDVTDPIRPLRVTGVDLSGSNGSHTARFHTRQTGRRSFQVIPRAGYRAALRSEARPKAELRAPAKGADYLVITPASLRSAIQPLVNHRASQGYRTAVVDLQSVYDAFSGGLPSAEAIRDFIAHAYHHWPTPAPSYVLLVGDGTYDPRNRLGKSPPTLLPPFLKEADPWLGEVAVENAFATVNGDDAFPDLFLGRLPVNSVAETTATVDKILSYEKKPATGPWRSRLLFNTDDPDSAGDFYAFSDDIANEHVPPGYSVERVYLGRTHADAAAARAEIARALGEGVLLSQYIGHGLHTGWSQELMFRRSDMLDLRNGGRLPILLDMTCMVGYFNDPLRFSISESAVRMAGGGAIAAFSPTGFGVATGHDIMNRAFIDLLLGQGASPLGAVAVASKIELGAGGYHRDLVETFALFGDPALRIPLAILPQPTTTPGATVQVVPTDTPVPTPTPSPTEEPIATPAGTGEPDTTPTAPATDEPSATETSPDEPTATPVAGETATDEPSATATEPPSATATEVPSATATHDVTPKVTPPDRFDTPTATPSPSLTATPKPSATAKPPRVKRYLPLILTYRPRRR